MKSGYSRKNEEKENNGQLVSLVDYLQNIGPATNEKSLTGRVPNEGLFTFDEKPANNEERYMSSFNSVQYGKIIEDNEELRKENSNLKRKEEKYLKNLLLMERKIEFYEKNSATHPQSINGEIDFKNSSDLNLMALNSHWENELRHREMKHQNETRGYKQNGKMLLTQLREAQAKNKMTDGLKTAVDSLNKKISELEERNKILEEEKNNLERLKGSRNADQEAQGLKHKSESEKESIQIIRNLQKDNDDLRARAEELEKMNEQAMEKLKEAAKKIKSLREELEKKNVNQSKEINKLVVQSLVAEVKGLKSEMSDLRETVRLSNNNADSRTSLTCLLKNFLLTHQMFKNMRNSVAGIYEKEIKYLKEQYLREVKQRKMIFNKFLELKGNIRVFCRIRPHKLGEPENCVTIQDDYTLTIENKFNGKIKTFDFDRVFPTNCSQNDIYNEISPLITSSLDGFNVCIFAYGQTGSGKTYTMEGPPENRGVYYKTIQEIFQTVSDRSPQFDYKIQISLLEIYNEMIRDLFSENQNKKLEIKQGPNGNYVSDLSIIDVQNPDEVREHLRRGAKTRAVGKTNLNDHSSRSHLVFTIFINGVNLVDNITFSSKLHLIDLAGSERLSKSKVQGEAQKESIAINKSLSALGDVIAAKYNKTPHVPFRNSTLTYLLQDSLSGDSKLLMILQISPSQGTVEESTCSLKFASRAKSVEMGPVKKNIIKKK